MQDIVVVSSFPPADSTHHEKLVGVASYAKNTLASLKKHKPNLTITVLAEKLPHVIPDSDPESPSGKNEILKQVQDDSKAAYSDSGITVERVWQRGSLSSYGSILQAIAAHPSATTVMIEFELAMFGGLLSLLFFPLFLLLVRLQGKKIILVMHQVVDNINDMHGHIGIKNNSIWSYLINFCVHVFYPLIVALSTRVVVFDSALKDILSKISTKEKIVVIPHGVEQFENIPSPLEARKKLDISNDSFVVLCFGFLAWYKGTDVLVEEFKKIKNHQHKTIQLILAGGPNPNHTDKPFYNTYIQNIKKEAQKLGITITGFVDEKDIPLYFQAADLVVLPYRTFMSSSGPLSLALSFHKPFLLSQALEPLFETSDMQVALRDEAINKGIFISPLHAFGETIEKLYNKRSTLQNMESFSRKMAAKRSWNHIAPYYYEILSK